MEQLSPADAAAEKISSALNGIEAENPHLQEVLRAFRGILLEQARWKAELPVLACAEIAPPDPERFGQGVSLTDREWLSRLGDLWTTAAERMIPALIVGFPKIRQELEKLQSIILKSDFATDLLLGAMFSGRAAEAHKYAEATGLTSDVLEFALTQATRPVVEKRSETLAPLIAGLTWHKGYCPLCGSPPGLSLLKEKEGQRWLRCGFCANTWRFHRTTCPFCETQGADDFEFIFVEGRDHERIETCHQCKRYLIGIDLRNLANEPVLEVAGFAVLHLDAIAQEKGYLPINSSTAFLLAPQDESLQIS